MGGRIWWNRINATMYIEFFVSTSIQIIIIKSNSFKEDASKSLMFVILPEKISYPTVFKW